MTQFVRLFLLVSIFAWVCQSAELEAVVQTEIGTFRIEFRPDKAPKHVEQFQRLVKQGYYDGSAFHRVSQMASCRAAIRC